MAYTIENDNPKIISRFWREPSATALDLFSQAFSFGVQHMNRRFVIWIFLCISVAGCQSPKWSQNSTSTRPAEPRIIPQVATAPRPGEESTNVAGKISMRPTGKAIPAPAPFGDYDSTLVAAIQNHWEELLKKQRYRLDTGKQGKVVVKFGLHADGSVSDVEVVESTLSADLLVKLSQAAVTESAPFAPWPDSMKQMISDGIRELTFTFYYQ